MSVRLKWLIAVAVFVAIGLCLVAANYMAGFLFLAFAKMNPLHVKVSTWWHYWSWYHDVPTIRKRLMLTMIFSAGFSLVVPAIIVAKLSEVKQSLYGEARFATDAEIRKAGLM
ncbi:hypothetical protein [Burkholderia cenocepacia]|uniref:hypothetical protein n=1 Tax=Burkholderia cenocepacia TaxID=95486 RepID=UPI000F59BBA1|nr:hypothetical protein [Burkholderia cenocepacia]RQU83902.1 hypothetical protein DF040_33800 [Burkholderia cenocepacia]